MSKGEYRQLLARYRDVRLCQVLIVEDDLAWFVRFEVITNGPVKPWTSPVLAGAVRKYNELVAESVARKGKKA